MEQQPTRTSWSTGTITTLIAGVAIVGGSVAPWAKVSAGLLERSVGGMDGDGKITIALGIVIVLLALVSSSPTSGNGPAVGIFLFALGAGGVAIYDTVNVSDKAKQAESASSFVSASVGWGLYIVIAGSALALIGALMLANRSTNSAGGVSGSGAFSSLRPCPWCAEPIQPAAKVCKHCGREVEPVASALEMPTPGTAQNWLPDPSGRFPDRFWDGAAWTKWVRDKPGGTRSEDPPLPWPTS